ncbi:MAG TPA: membrane protein insertase YidC [Gemmatimonadales bacterium]|nr:membrane protein insertase YidC [Gemmatimonadales bacterium]
MDRRFIWAIVLMTLIVMAPAVLLKKPGPVGSGEAGTTDSGVVSAPPPVVADSSAPLPRVPASPPSAAPAPEDSVRIYSELFTYTVSTRGARLIGATLPFYKSMAPADSARPVQLVPPETDLLGLRLVRGADTLRLEDWSFTPSTTALSVGGPSTVTFTAAQGDVQIALEYTFQPDDYRIGVRGSVTGIGPNGALLLVGLGPGFRNTEANPGENQREMGFVTKDQSGTRLTRLQSLDAGQTRTLSGPFDWVAVKSKYFVTALLAFREGDLPVSGLTAQPIVAPEEKKPHHAAIWLSFPVSAEGRFGYELYAGPMEYSRLARVGHDFDDVNPYGWPGFRTIIRPVAIGVRWLLVWMHDHLNLAYGMVLVFFGILVRLILWPLNQKAMRSTMAMQAIQPELQRIQEKYKQDPQRLQQEMFKLYKEHNVNPFGGCWPMLLPMPVLLALFFVFQNTIELRGQAFMWLPDLSRPDPYYIIPLLMGLSMFGLTKVGQLGMPPNPQTKMMMYVMPVMMTVLFVNFASGLNLYYAVQNLASIPQQWHLAKERMKRGLGAPPQPAPTSKKKKD